MEDKTQTLKLSAQAMGAIMMSLQKCIMHQIDIVEILADFDLALDENDMLIVTNPPVIEVPKSEEVEQ